MADQLPREIDIDPPAQLSNWNAGGQTQASSLRTDFIVAMAQRIDIANLFIHVGTYLTSQQFAANPPVLPVAGPYSAANPPPATIQNVLCSVKISQGFIHIIQNDPFFAGLPGGGAILFTLSLGANPTFVVNVQR